MITNESIMNAELIEFEQNENGQFIEKRDSLINNTIVVIQNEFIVDINTQEKYEMYRLDTNIEPNKKYIFKLSKPERIDLKLYTKALIAFNEFLNKEFNVDSNEKVLKFKPNKKRD